MSQPRLTAFQERDRPTMKAPSTSAAEAKHYNFFYLLLVTPSSPHDVFLMSEQTDLIIRKSTPRSTPKLSTMRSIVRTLTIYLHVYST